MKPITTQSKDGRTLNSIAHTCEIKGSKLLRTTGESVRWCLENNSGATQIRFVGDRDGWGMIEYLDSKGERETIGDYAKSEQFAWDSAWSFMIYKGIENYLPDDFLLDDEASLSELIEWNPAIATAQVKILNHLRSHIG
jgi:hypothetical protein